MDLELISSESSKTNFYPTPESLIDKMLSGIQWDEMQTVLEPSAGKGDIAKAIALKKPYNHPLDIDCIEIDVNLQQILKYNFSDEKERSIRDEIKKINDKKTYNSTTHDYEYPSSSDKAKVRYLENERKIFDSEVHFIHNDFFTYSGYKKYDLIVMNPPFDCGEKHLLQALNLQSRGGKIVCLLNAETIRNPYTELRKTLAKRLTDCNADIQFLQGEFETAERPTKVEVALIKVDIPRVVEESDIFERIKKAEEVTDNYNAPTDLVIADFVKEMVQLFNVEVKASLELIRQYENLQPYILAEIPKCGEPQYYNHSILMLSVGDKTDYAGRIDKNKYLQKVRSKYWQALLCDRRFTGKLTSNLQNKYREMTDRLKDYDFTEFNIRQIFADINAEMIDGVKDTILALFDKLTAEHSWYPECSNNRHYFNGWKSNKAHMIGKKSIIPEYLKSDSWSSKTFDTYRALSVISDIEKVFNYLDGNTTAEFGLSGALDRAEREGRTRHIQCKYFEIDIYKKGTVHINYTSPEIVNRLNIYAALNKNWLPPCYGKKQYSEMDQEEAAVIDAFQGKEAYAKVMENRDYYIVAETTLLALGA